MEINLEQYKVKCEGFIKPLLKTLNNLLKKLLKQDLIVNKFAKGNGFKFFDAHFMHNSINVQGP